jgi:hypothetical protein
MIAVNRDSLQKAVHLMQDHVKQLREQARTTDIGRLMGTRRWGWFGRKLTYEEAESLADSKTYYYAGESWRYKGTGIELWATRMQAVLDHAVPGSPILLDPKDVHAMASWLEPD